jgi:hypothetical protein
MMSLLASGASGSAGLGSAEIFGAGKFVARIIDDLVRTKFGSGVRTEPINLARKNGDHEQQE